MEDARLDPMISRPRHCSFPPWIWLPHFFIFPFLRNRSQISCVGNLLLNPTTSFAVLELLFHNNKEGVGFITHELPRNLGRLLCCYLPGMQYGYHGLPGGMAHNRPLWTHYLLGLPSEGNVRRKERRCVATMPCTWM